jgi:hypothetical protein
MAPAVRRERYLAPQVLDRTGLSPGDTPGFGEYSDLIYCPIALYFLLDSTRNRRSYA